MTVHHSSAARGSMKRRISLNCTALLICVAASVPARADGLDAGPTDKLALDVPRLVTLPDVS